MLMRFDPFRELDPLAQGLGRSAVPLSLPMDAYRRGDEFVINLDLPGVDPASVDVTVEQNVLTISAQRSWQPDDGDQVLVAERPQGDFTRQLFLGATIDAERIAARYEHGVLTVTAPVAGEVKPRRVEINGATDREAIGAVAPTS